jgi:hypothetical protein
MFCFLFWSTIQDGIWDSRLHDSKSRVWVLIVDEVGCSQVALWRKMVGRRFKSEVVWRKEPKWLNTVPLAKSTKSHRLRCACVLDQKKLKRECERVITISDQGESHPTFAERKSKKASAWLEVTPHIAHQLLPILIVCVFLCARRSSMKEVI